MWHCRAMPSSRVAALAALFLATPLFGCQSTPRPAAPATDVAVEPPPSGATPPPAPPEDAGRSAPTGYLTATYGCEPLVERAAADLLERANAAIQRAGEHPTPADLDEILPLLHRAAYGGYLPAQRRYGYYVVGYWYTDEMFWPRSEPIAVSALAMLRVAAQRERAGAAGPLDDALLEALASDPVTFSEEEGPPALPEEWVKLGVAEAERWTACTTKR